MARVSKKLSERVKEKLVREDDCIIWTGAMAGGSPVIAKMKDGQWRNMNIRAMQGVKRYPDTTLRTQFKTTCGNPRCIKPEHIVIGRQTINERRCRSGTRKANAAVNIAVFDAVVRQSLDQASSEVNLAHSSLVNIIRHNTAMYPYFYTLLDEICDVNGVKNSDQSRVALAEQYNISIFAVEFLQKHTYEPIKDVDAFKRLLVECEVHNDHLVWVGDEVENPQELLGKAAFGAAFNNKKKCTCGYKGCVNPYHYEDI